MAILDIIAHLVSLTITVMSYAMAIRMILPLFITPEESRLYAFTCLLSEPIVAPVRTILYIFGIGDSLPMDFALPTAYILLFIIKLLLPEI